MTMTFRHGQSVTLVAAVIAIWAGLSGQPLKASTVAVGGCIADETNFLTIQAAVTAAPAGSTIKVCPGNYPEQVVINKNLTLKGVESGTAYNPVLVVPAGGFVSNSSSLGGASLASQIVVESPATDVEISYLAVDGTGNNLNAGCGDTRLVGIFFKSASGTLNYVVARNQAQNVTNFDCATSAGLGIFIESAGPSTPASVTIKNSSVYGYQKNGITADETGTTVTLNGNSVVGAGPVGIAQNGIQIAYGATGIVENNTVANDISTVPDSGIATGILVYDSGDLAISGNSVAFTQTGIAIVTDGSQGDNYNTLTNNQVVNTQLGDGIDLCSNGNTVTSNTVFSSSQSGIHLDSSCGSSPSTGNGNIVSKNVVNDSCAGILLGSGTDNTFPTAGVYANVANITLAGDTCTPVIVPNVLVKSHVSAAGGHHSSPVRP